MIRKHARPLLLASAFLACGGLGLATPAMAQGPYGRNTYADFPYNQGSMAYRPLKPGAPPAPAVGPAAAPARRYVQPSYNYYVPQTAPRAYYGNAPYGYAPYGYQVPQGAYYGYQQRPQGWYYVQPGYGYGYR